MYKVPIFKPDLAQLDGMSKDITGYVKNLLPYRLGYKSVMGYSSFSDIPVPEKVLGVNSFLKANDGRDNYFLIGTTKGIYRFLPKGSATYMQVQENVVGLEADNKNTILLKLYETADLPDTNQWEFIMFSNYIFALTEDRPLVYLDTLSPDKRFKEVEIKEKVNNQDVVTHIMGRAMNIWGNHLVVGGILNSKTQDRNMVAWSNLNAPLDWHKAKDSDADDQQFFSGGRVITISGGNKPYIFMDNKIYRGVYIPSSSLIFQFEEYIKNIGIFSKKSLITINDVNFFYSDSGFYRLDSNGVIVNIGEGVVNKYIKDNCKRVNLIDMKATLMFHDRYIGWSYKKSDNSNYRYDSILVYDYTLDLWSELDLKHNEISQAYSFGYTLEGLDYVCNNLDKLPYSLDSEVWMGGSSVVAVIDEHNKVGGLLGAYMPSEIETNLVTSEDGGVVEITGVRLDTNNKGYECLYKGSYQNDPYVANHFNVGLSERASLGPRGDWVFLRKRDRYLRARFILPKSSVEYYINNFDLRIRRAGKL